MFYPLVECSESGSNLDFICPWTAFGSIWDIAVISGISAVAIGRKAEVSVDFTGEFCPNDFVWE